MHRIHRLLLACVLLGMGGCGILPFDVGQDLPEQTVEPNPLGGVVPIPNFLNVPVTINIQSELEKRDISSLVYSINMRSLTLSATPASNPSGNFDFLENVHIFIEAPNNSSLGRPEIAYLDPVPDGQTSVTFTIAKDAQGRDIDLRPFIEAGSRVTAEATGRYPQSRFTFNGHLRITVRF